MSLRAGMSPNPAGVHNRSNDPPSIGDLPQELFVKVLSAVYLLSESEGMRAGSDWTNPYRLVCRRWRDVICSTPQFWQEICPTRKPEWLELCLARCAGTLITVDAQAAVCLSAAFTTLCRYATSLRECRANFNADDIQWLAGLSSLLTTPLPALEALTIRSELYHRPLGDSAAITHSLVPRLTALDLHIAVAPSDAAIYPSLRRLNLSESFWTSSYVEFLDVLGTCRALEYLSLWNQSFHFFEYDLQVMDPAKKRQPLARPVVLPKLRVLRLFGPTPIVYRLLAVIHAPKAAMIKFASILDIDDDECGPDLALLLAPSPQQRYPFLASPTIISVRCWDEAPFGLCARSEPDNNTLLYYLDHRRIDSSWNAYLTQNLTAIIDILPVASVSTLIVEGSISGVPVNLWQRIFQAFSSLCKLHLKGRGTLDSFWIGLERATLASVEGGGAVCCPSLSVITTEARSGPRYKFAATMRLFDLIRGALGARAVHCTEPLKKLKLRLLYSKNIWEQTAELREAFVQDVRALVEELDYREVRMHE